MVSAWPEPPSAIPAEWPAERTAGARTKRKGTGVRSITTGRQFLLARWLQITARAATGRTQGVSNSPFYMHDDKLGARGDDKAHNSRTDNRGGNIPRNNHRHSKHACMLADKPAEHVAGRVHNSTHSLVELGLSPPSSHSGVLRLGMEMLSQRRRR